MSHTQDNGIYYFLGNMASHILHALPLYKEIGGTFVVTSHKAAKVLSLYDVPYVCIDDVPYVWKWNGKRPQRTHEYIAIDNKFAKTTNYLNLNARVVIFYELFDYPGLSEPRRVFLTHGNMLKNYFKMHPRRLEIINQYDHMAALGPFMKQEFIRSGIDRRKLIDIGIARTDEVIAEASANTTERIQQLGIPTDKPVVSYLPTFWGDSTVDGLGIQILDNISEDYTVIFRPHPQTPKKIISKYAKVLSHNNVFFLPETGGTQPSLIDVYAASSIIIGDLSSVMLEAILLNKPLIFALPPSQTNIEPHSQLENIKRICKNVSSDNVANINTIIKESLNTGINKDVWENTKANSFFYSGGGSAKAIAKFIHSLV